jgi:hypothetical protein
VTPRDFRPIASEAARDLAAKITPAFEAFIAELNTNPAWLDELMAHAVASDLPGVNIRGGDFGRLHVQRTLRGVPHGDPVLLPSIHEDPLVGVLHIALQIAWARTAPPRAPKASAAPV